MTMTDDDHRRDGPEDRPPCELSPDDTPVGHDGYVTMPELQPEQAKGLPEVSAACRVSHRQRKGMRRCGTLRRKGSAAVDRVMELRAQRQQADEDVARATGSTRKHRIRLPYWLPLLWVPIVIWLLSRIEKRFVAFLPGLLSISGFVAWFIAGTIEAAAWWLGRSAAARFEAHSITQLKPSERRALYWAVPLVASIQGALLVLRLVRTGQLTSSIALSAAALLLFAISVWVHELSTDGAEDERRRAVRRSRRVARRLRRANAEYVRLGAKWRRALLAFIVEPAKAKLAAAAEIMTGIDALVRQEGRAPNPWPLPLQVHTQDDLAHERLPPELRYPSLLSEVVTTALDPRQAITALEAGR